MQRMRVIICILQYIYLYVWVCKHRYTYNCHELPIYLFDQHVPDSACPVGTSASTPDKLQVKPLRASESEADAATTVLGKHIKAVLELRMH